MKSMSKLTSKYQATIPKSVREKLGLTKGDVVVFDVFHEHVIVTKAAPLDLEYLASVQGTLGEWNSKNDEEAYRDL